MSKPNEYVNEILLEMENRGFTQGEVELVPKMLMEAIEENSKRFEYHKPFAVFRFATDCND